MLLAPWAVLLALALATATATPEPGLRGASPEPRGKATGQPVPTPAPPTPLPPTPAPPAPVPATPAPPTPLPPLTVPTPAPPTPVPPAPVPATPAPEAPAPGTPPLAAPSRMVGGPLPSHPGQGLGGAEPASSVPEGLWNVTLMANRTIFAAMQVEPCLCIFDIDRTLTGKQGLLEDDGCFGNEEFQKVADYAYGGGSLTLSQVAAHFQVTFCAECYLGIVSHGSASSSEMKRELLTHFQGTRQVPGQYDWSYDCDVASPLVLECAEGQKQAAVRRIVGWYERNGVAIADREVYFFDDRQNNVEPFLGTGFNARQVSCRSRSDSVGLCGAETVEILPEKGVSICAP